MKGGDMNVPVNKEEIEVIHSSVKISHLIIRR